MLVSFQSFEPLSRSVDQVYDGILYCRIENPKFNEIDLHICNFGSCRYQVRKRNMSKNKQKNLKLIN